MNPEPIRTIHGKHADAHIIYDDGAGSSPREWSNIGTIAMRSKPRTSIIDPRNGDTEYADLYDQLIDMIADVDQRTAFILDDPASAETDEEEQAAKDAAWNTAIEHYAMLAIQLRDYGSGQLKLWADGDFDECDGIVYISMDEAKKEAPERIRDFDQDVREWAEAVMTEEIKTFEQYLNGEVYGIVILNLDGEHQDSCYGFYGDPFEQDGYIIREALEMLGHVELRLHRRFIYDPMNMTPFGGRHNTYV